MCVSGARTGAVWHVDRRHDDGVVLSGGTSHTVVTLVFNSSTTSVKVCSPKKFLSQRTGACRRGTAVLGHHRLNRTEP